MSTTPYNFLGQSILASCLIQIRDDDSFFNPVALQHTGFAYDGNYYAAGVPGFVGSPPVSQASWFLEGVSTFRGATGPFPTAGLVLLSPAALSIFEDSSVPLTLWMGFLLGDGLALSDNYTYGATTVGYTPSAVQYANGIVTVTMTPDPGSSNQSILAVNIDFIQDTAYLDSSVAP